MLSTCTSTQQPYRIQHPSNPASFYYPANTPGESCTLLAATNSWKLIALDEFSCTVKTTPEVWPIVKQCEPPLATTTSSTTPAQTYDYTVLGAFWAFGFTGVMLLYFTSHAVGLVVKAVRDF